MPMYFFFLSACDLFFLYPWTKGFDELKTVMYFSISHNLALLFCEVRVFTTIYVWSCLFTVIQSRKKTVHMYRVCTSEREWKMWAGEQIATLPTKLYSFPFCRLWPKLNVYFYPFSHSIPMYVDKCDNVWVILLNPGKNMTALASCASFPRALHICFSLWPTTFKLCVTRGWKPAPECTISYQYIVSISIKCERIQHTSIKTQSLWANVSPSHWELCRELDMCV